MSGEKGVHKDMLFSRYNERTRIRITGSETDASDNGIGKVLFTMRSNSLYSVIGIRRLVHLGRAD